MAPKQSKKKTAKKKAAIKKPAKKKAAVKRKPAKTTVTKTKAKSAATTAEKPKKRKRKKSTDKKQHYVNSKEFYEEIKEYYKTDIIPDKLAESLLKIATGLSFAPNFINYSWKDEMIGDAVLKMFSALKHKKFKIETGNNPFSYFTTIAYHAFINRIKKESKHRDTISKYQEAMYGDAMTESNGGTGTVYVDQSGEERDDYTG